MKYLPLYYEWMETGYLPQPGLCNCLPFADEYLSLMEPGVGESPVWYAYWGYDGNYNLDSCRRVLKKFTPLRQNILLFISAMNNEL